MKKAFVVVGLVVALVFTLSAFTCSHKAMQTSVGVAASLKALQDTETAFHNQGTLTADEHVLLQKQFKVLFQTDKDVRQCIYIKGGPACVDIGINAVNAMLKDPAVVGIKNEDSKKQIELLGQGVITSLNALKAAL